MASWRPPESDWVTGGPSRPLGNLIWVVLGCAWSAPGDSWAALGPPGALLAAPGAHLGLPGVTFWSLLDLFLVSPCEIAKTSKFVDSMALFAVFQVPRAPKSLGNRLWAAQLGYMGLKWRYMGSKLSYIGSKWRYIGRFRPHVEVPRAVGTQRNSRNVSQGRSKTCLSINTLISTP